ncbi:MAG: PEP-CTERM sorting domain-containing protein [Merismopedia sp. SIO2A8]|nr:PEP-CTERM sorting domain-containing protein [Merismopedia sp. SIO2A8]
MAIAASGQAAEAASVVNRWEANTAYKDQFGIGNSHAFALPDLGAGRFVFQDNGVLEEYDDGTARLTGTVVSNQDSNKFWEVDVWFDAASNKVKAKKELKDGAYDSVSEGGGGLDEDNLGWWYYGVDESRSFLTGGGYYEDIVLNIKDGKGYDRGAEVQLGYGASGKNVGMGMAAWIGYDAIHGEEAGVFIANSMRADINVDLIAVPEPASLVGLGLVGLGLYARRKSQGTEDT